VECSIAASLGRGPALAEASARENQEIKALVVDTTGCCDVGMTCLVIMSHLRDWTILIAILLALTTCREFVDRAVTVSLCQLVEKYPPAESNRKLLHSLLCGWVNVDLDMI
jgi:hypothetical protein